MEFALVVLALVVAGGIAFAIVVLATGDDPGLVEETSDDLPPELPSDRPLVEADVNRTTFDTGLRGYRTGQVDAAMTRLAYDIGFKDELVRVLAGEVSALRDGRVEDADRLRDNRLKAFGSRALDPVPAPSDDDADHVDTADDRPDTAS